MNKIETSTFNESIACIFEDLMEEDPSVLLWGPGTNDPKSVFDTTKNIKHRFSDKRSFDGAISEAAYTGHALGLSLGGHHPIIHYQRIDFAFMAWDQIINNISKWHSMFGEKISTPLILRAIVGRGWGQGQQHSQSPLRMLTSFPGIDIYCPTTPQQAYNTYYTAHKRKKPSFVIEHRWLQSLTGPKLPVEELGDITIYSEGDDITLISYSYGVIECLRAHQHLLTFGIKAKVVGVNIFNDDSHQTIQETFAEPTNGIVFDLTWKKASPLMDYLQLRESQNLALLSLENEYTPTSVHLTKDYYPDAKTIIRKALSMLKKEELLEENALQVDQFPDKPLIDDILLEFGK